MAREFDAYAEQYDEALNRGLALAGESKDYFASERTRWLEACLRARSASPGRVLDFGCGTGSAVPHLLAIPGVRAVVGVDTSEASLAVARKTHADARVSFALVEAMNDAGAFDLAFCNGVFHHIPIEERPAALDAIRRVLAPGGHFAFWENNPWNPGTRLVMSRIPFDRDAQTMSARSARAMLRAAGFEPVRTDHLFLFPHALRMLRPLERLVTGLPAGAQYQVLCRVA